jgi:cbb3-type cytochrome oxidase maturation protein
VDEATIAQTILTLSILLIFVGFLIWGIKSGQFHHVEEAKYRMLSDTKSANRNLNNSVKQSSYSKAEDAIINKDGEEKRK